MQPLQGRKIVVTRPEGEKEGLTRLLSSMGAEVIRFPVIAISPPDRWEATDRVIENLGDFDWIIFTSVNGVRAFLNRIRVLKKSINEILAGIQICAIGIKTAEALEEYNCSIDFIPETFRAESIVEGFKRMGFYRGKVVIPRAEEGREILPKELSRMGLEVEVIPVYKVIKPEMDIAGLKNRLTEKGIDVITFTSGSCVRNFIESLGMKEYKILLAGVKIACISPVTGEVVQDFDLEAHIIPERYTVEDLAEAIVLYYRRCSNGLPKDTSTKNAGY